MPDKSLGFSVFASEVGFNRLKQALRELASDLDKLDRKKANPTVDVDTKKAEAQLGAFAESMHRRLERAIRSLPDVELKADASSADRRIAQIRRELQSIADKRIGIDIDAGAAQAQIARLRAELASLGSRSANIQVRADTAAASASLAAVRSQVNRLDGQQANIAVGASDISRLISLTGVAIAGIAALAAVAAPAAAGIAAIGVAATAALQGVGALSFGLSGIGGAVKALAAEETKSAAGTAVSTSARINSMQAIESAQRNVDQAIRAADRAAVQGAQQVTDARARIAEVAEDGARRIADAERGVASAQNDARNTQEDLTRARVDAREEIEDLSLTLRGAALSEEEAVLRLADAQEELAKGRASGLTGRPLQQLDVDARQAALSLDTARERHADLAQETERANRQGVEGSDRVVAAQERAQDAAAAVSEAERNLADARGQAARDNAQAAQQLARAQQQARFAQQEAAERVTDAQRALTNAMVDMGAQGGAAANKVKEAMENLSPEAQRFARFIVSDVLPGLRKIRDQVQATLLPRLETSMRNLGTLGPEVGAGLAETGRVIGDLSIKASEMMTNGPFRSDFRTLMAGNNRILEDFGEAGIDVASALMSIAVTSQPLTERFSQFVERSAETGRQFIETKRATGELDAFFDQMSDTLAELFVVLGDIVVGLFRLSQTLAPIGMQILRLIGDFVQFIGHLAEAHPLLIQLFAVLMIGVSAFNTIGRAVAGASIAAGVASGGWKILLGVLTGLGPASIASSAGMLAFGRGMDAAALKAGTAAERFGGFVVGADKAASAGEKVATAGSKVSGVLTKIGSALPVIGIAVVALAVAYDALNTSANEAAEGLAEGGAAAAKVTADLLEAERQAEKHSFGNWIGELRSAIGLATPTLEEAKSKLEDLRNEMDPLSRATADATRAQNDYLFALERGDMAAAAEAQGRYTTAIEEQARQQRILDTDLRNTNTSLQDQINLIIGSAQSDLAYRNALHDRQIAQRNLNDAIRDNGAASDEAKEAGFRLEAAELRVIEATGRLAAENSGLTTETDKARVAAESQRTAILSMATSADGRGSPALQALAGRFTDAEIAAHNAMVETSGFHHEVRILPDGRTVKIAVDAETGEVIDFGNRMAALRDRTVRVHADGTYSLPAMGRALIPSGPSPQFATGGVLPGYTPGRDVHTFSSPTGGRLGLSGGEAIMRPEWTRAVGEDWIHGANRAAQTGGVSSVRKYLMQNSELFFAAGGIYPHAPDVVTEVHAEVQREILALQVAQIKKLLAGGMLGNASGPGGWQWQMQMLRRVFPGLQLISGFRPGSITATGNLSYHARGRAVDVPPRHDVFNWVKGTYGAKTKELIFSPAGTGQVWNGRPHYYSEPTRGDHWDHVHWAYDNGGMLAPGMRGVNTTNQPERVLSPQQTESFDRLVEILSTIRGFTIPQVAVSGGTATAAVHKHFHLTVHSADNTRVDLETQFHRLELRAGIG